MVASARKRVGVRLVAENGERVKAELEGIGDSGERAFDKIEKKSTVTGRAVKVALAAMAAAGAAAATMMIRSSMQTISAQSDVAQSLNTTVESMQALHHAASLAGVATGEAEGGVRRLTRRLSLFAQSGGGPAAAAIEKLNLNAHELLQLPIDQRLMRVNEALDQYASEAERAALLSQLFGDNSWMAFSRLNTDILRSATDDIHDFGVAVSEVDAAQIGRASTALGRLGLISQGVANQLTIAVAPSLEALANGMAAVASRTGPLGQAIQLVFGNLDRLATYAATFAAFMAGRWVVALAAARGITLSLSGALVVLRGALIRTGIGALIVGVGELIYWFSRLVSAAGGVGNTLSLLGEVASGVWDGIATSARSIPPRLQSIWASVRGGFFRMLEALQTRWTDFLMDLSGGVRNIPGFDGVADSIFAAGSRSSATAHGFSSAAHQAEEDARRLGEEARRLVSEGFDKARDAVGRLADVIRSSGAESEIALNGAAESAAGVAEAFEAAGDAAEEAGDKGEEAGQKIEEAGEEAATGWAKTVETIQKYAAEAMDMAGSIGDSVVGAFQAAENAVVDFVRTGKLSVSDLVSSIIADLARLAVRRFILGPIASALGGIFSGPAAGPTNLLSFVDWTDSFDGGGHTGYGARVGGLDGKGGYLAMVHPRERIIDETRGGRGGGGGGLPPVMITINTANAESFRQSRTQVAADIQRAVAMGQRGM